VLKPPRQRQTAVECGSRRGGRRVLKPPRQRQSAEAAETEADGGRVLKPPRQRQTAVEAEAAEAELECGPPVSSYASLRHLRVFVLSDFPLRLA
jgi:hypothetical protein